MGILSNIFSKIFHKTPEGSTSSGTASATPNVDAALTPPAPISTPGASPQTTAATMSETDVEAVLDGMAATQSQKLNWQTSIVDLMKLLDIDSSLQSRKELAQELKYAGDMSDSASMNIWLHKQVMKQLSANGGKVPAALLD